VLLFVEDQPYFISPTTHIYVCIKMLSARSVSQDMDYPHSESSFITSAPPLSVENGIKATRKSSQLASRQPLTTSTTSMTSMTSLVGSLVTNRLYQSQTSSGEESGKWSISGVEMSSFNDSYDSQHKPPTEL
jgi:hypothetical protein